MWRDEAAEVGRREVMEPWVGVEVDAAYIVGCPQMQLLRV